MSKINLLSVPVLAVSILAGCSNAPQQSEKETVEIKYTPEYRALEQQLEQANAELELKKAALTEQNKQAVGTDSSLPANSKPGECYARVLIPAEYSFENEKIEVNPETQRIEINQPKYEWKDKKILVREAYERIEVIPATYKTITETVEVSTPTRKLIKVPAVYKTVKQQVLVRPAHTVWKKGTGPVQKTDEVTGEIMCLVNVPAEYRTVTKKVLETPETIRMEGKFGKIKPVTRRVIDRPEAIRTVLVPAEYRIIKVRRLIKPAELVKVRVPAEYKDVSRKVKTKDAYLEWRQILCRTNARPEVVKKLQLALKAQGYNPGNLDGVFGTNTLNAVIKYQKDNNLPSGQLTIDTLKSLNISP